MTTNKKLKKILNKYKTIEQAINAISNDFDRNKFINRLGVVQQGIGNNYYYNCFVDSIYKSLFVNNYSKNNSK